MYPLSAPTMSFSAGLEFSAGLVEAGSGVGVGAGVAAAFGKRLPDWASAVGSESAVNKHAAIRAKLETASVRECLIRAQFRPLLITTQQLARVSGGVILFG